MDQNTVDYRVTAVGRQNWEVCERMLAHDLVDLSYIPEIKALLDYYRITVLSNGAHSMALPRKMLNKFKKSKTDKLIDKMNEAENKFQKALKKHKKK